MTADLLPGVVADLAARHNTTNGAPMSDEHEMSEIPGQCADMTPGAVWHMDPDLHAHVVATQDEIAQHFLDVRLTADVPEWLAQRQAAAEEGMAR